MGPGERTSEVGTDGSLLALLRVLSSDPDGRTLATAVARGLLSEWSPYEAWVYLHDPDDDVLVEVATFGADVTHPTDYTRVPLDLAAPFVHAFRTGEEVAMTLAASVELFPAVAGFVAAHPHGRTAEGFVLPFRAAGRTVGVLGLVFTTPVERTWRLRAALDSAVAALSVWALTPTRTYAVAPRRRGVTPTPRQRRILDLLASGSTNGDIAADLGVSVGTVKTDLAHLFRLYDVRDRQSLARIASTVAAADGLLDGAV